MPAKTILKMAMEGGQACLGGSAGLDGAIRPGARQISSDWIKQDLLAATDRLPHDLESVNAGDVRDSISAGRCL